jgi:hypothetical protein
VVDNFWDRASYLNTDDGASAELTIAELTVEVAPVIVANTRIEFRLELIAPV